MDIGEQTGITKALARILSERASELGLSLRDIQERSGVPHSTVGRILEAKTAISLNKFEAISHALGLTPWKVMREAELRLERDAVQEYVDVTDAKLRATKAGDFVPAAHPPIPDSEDRR